MRFCVWLHELNCFNINAYPKVGSVTRDRDLAFRSFGRSFVVEAAGIVNPGDIQCGLRWNPGVP